jgi:selenide,water dikinase
VRRLVLVGGGHAHLAVLRDFARERPPGLRGVLVTPRDEAVYSGMVPGVVAGHYEAADCQLPLAALAAAAGVEFVRGELTALDAAERRLMLADGSSRTYDLLSLDTGSVAPRESVPGAAAHALFTRPIEDFMTGAAALVERAAAQPLHVVVCGGGAAGFELVCALAHRLSRGQMPSRLSLITGGPPVLAGYPRRAIESGRRALKRWRVTVFEEACVAIAPEHVELAGGSRLACDAVVMALGAAAPTWLGACGLQLDERGFVATGPTLQSVSHGQVFAAGDVASRIDAPHPKSGVYAVRAGPALALNLRRALAGGQLEPHRPPARTLNLLSCGDRRAILAWGDWSVQGAWVWRWKDRIDRAFVAAYR